MMKNNYKYKQDNYNFWLKRLSNNKEDFVLSTDLQDWLKGKGVTITKLGRDINKYAEINKMANVSTTKKKLAGKSTNVWCGIKIIG
jgi:hypothetical protein